MSTRTYLTQPTAVVLLIISIIVILLALYLLIKRYNAKKNLNITDHKNNENIKSAKKLIYKYGLKKKTCGLHIFAASTSSELHINNLTSDCKLLNMSDGVSIGIKKESFSLFVEESHINTIEKLRATLGLHFSNINLHYELEKNNSYIDELPQEASNIKTNRKTTNVIINFYSYATNYDIDYFNNVIGKNNLHKLENDQVKTEGLFTKISSNIIKSDNNSKTKHSCISITNSIYKISYKISNELDSAKTNTYIFLILNKLNCFDSIRIKDNLTNKKVFNIRSILITTLSMFFSIAFISNIIIEIQHKNELQLSLDTYDNLSYKNFNDDIKDLEYLIDDEIWLSSIYPQSIKYRSIFIAKAKIISNKILIPEMSKSTSNFIMTAFLIYITHLNNKQDSANTDYIIDVLSKVAHISSDDLITIIKYSDDKTRQRITDKASTIANKFYYKHSAISNYHKISTFQDYETKYFGISDAERARTVYKALEESTYRCATDDLLSKLIIDRDTPKSFRNVFDLYKSEGSVEDSRCNTISTGIITSNMRMINYVTSELDSTSFKELFSTIVVLVDNLESSEDSLDHKSTEYKALHNIMPVLISFAVNTITNRTYHNSSLPLLNKLNDHLSIRFRTEFSNELIELSPLYSQVNIQQNVVPFMKQFNALITKLNNRYNLNTDFIVSIYNDALISYYNSYITVFDDATISLTKDKILVQQITNDNTLGLYFNTMSAKNSTFNNFLDYYKVNTSMKEAKSEIVQKFFEKEDAFLKSKEYSNYRQLFSQLNDMVNNDGYTKTYETLKNNYEPLDKIYTSLSNLSTTKTSSLYKALKYRVDIAVSAIEHIAIENTVDTLNTNIGSEYDYINTFIPLNYSSKKIMSNKDLASYIGKNGSIFNQFTTLLKPLLTYDKTKKQWYNDSFDSPKQERLLKDYNKLYFLNTKLWNKDGSSKKIKLDITPIQSKSYNYIFASIIINHDSFVNSLNIKYSEPTPILYGWSEKNPISITLKLEDGTTIQKNYSGDWSLIKAIKDSKCINNVCTWEMLHNGVKYPVTFKIESSLIDSIKN